MFLLQIRAQGRGELLVSLCWQPAANRLTVVVLKARNLPKMDVTGLAGKTEDFCHNMTAYYLASRQSCIICRPTSTANAVTTANTTAANKGATESLLCRNKWSSSRNCNESLPPVLEWTLKIMVSLCDVMCSDR